MLLIYLSYITMQECVSGVTFVFEEIPGWFCAKQCQQSIETTPRENARYLHILKSLII